MTTDNAPAGPSQRDRGRPSVDQVPVTQRFHVKTSLFFAGAIVTLVAAMGIWFFSLGLDYQVRALQRRLFAVATTLAHQIPPEEVKDLNGPEDKSRPQFAKLIELFARVVATEPEFVSIYVLRPTSDPDTFHFAADFTAPGRAPPAAIGEAYDVRQAKRMRDGLLRPTVEDDFTRDRWGTVLSGYAPIFDAKGTPVATVGVDVAADDVERLRWDVLSVTVSMCGLAIAVALMLALLLGRSIRTPLEAVVGATTEIAAGHLETRLGTERADEFGVLAQHLDLMAAGLQERDRIRSLFGRYVSEDVARRLLASSTGAALGGDERQVTIMLTDLAGYSTLSERQAPTDVVRMLNTYFELMGEIIDRHHGCLIEFTGDGLLCVFGAPEAAPEHAEFAVRCAVELQQALAEANHAWRADSEVRWRGQRESPLRMRIGVHTGVVVAGNIGTRTRTKYSVIGDVVNVAARIEQLNKEVGSQTLITEETYKRIPDDLRQLAVDRGEHLLKGRASLVRVFSLGEA